MNYNVTNNVSENIRKLRKEQGLSQDDLAQRLNTARPVISNWERNIGEPSASQLVKLAQIFSVSVDAIVSNGGKGKTAVVLDTSFLIKRPAILEELPEKFDEVIIPRVVIDELNHQKDIGKPFIKRKAALIMNMIKEVRDKVENIIILESKDSGGKNDEKIAKIAAERARIFSDKVYIFADDVWFNYLVKKEQSNLFLLGYNDYVSQFVGDNDFFDSEITQEFVALLKSRETAKIKELEYNSAIDINYIDPETGYTPLIQAVKNKDAEVLYKLLKDYEAAIDLDLPDKHKYGFTPLLHAAQIKNLNMMKLLADAGADIDVGSKGGKNSGNTPLMVCAWHEFYDGVEYLLRQGACFNQQDSNGYTALIKACIKGNSKIAALLIDKTDLNIRSKENKKAIEYINHNKAYSMELLKLFEGKVK
jgi:transcriptional regulator with XRE-family HTH domain